MGACVRACVRACVTVTLCVCVDNSNDVVSLEECNDDVTYKNA